MKSRNDTLSSHSSANSSRSKKAKPTEKPSKKGIFGRKPGNGPSKPSAGDAYENRAVKRKKTISDGMSRSSTAEQLIH